MNDELFYTSYLKIERAEEIINQINELLSSSPPYYYVLETNTISYERSTFAKKNSNSLDKITILCGDVFHNLRSAVDHAYYQIVEPYVSDEKKKRAIQFPFAKDEESIDKELNKRQAYSVSEKFVKSIKSLKPYASQNGNKYLTLLHKVNIIDKHKFPTPAGNYTKINSTLLKKQIQDFPEGIFDCGFGQCNRDVVWRSRQFNHRDIGNNVPPHMNLYQKILDVPVEIWFYINEPNYTGEILTTIWALVDETKTVLTHLKQI